MLRLDIRKFHCSLVRGNAHREYRNHIFPCSFGRRFACDVKIDNVFSFQFLFHRGDCFVAHSARTAPEVAQISTSKVCPRNLERMDGNKSSLETSPASLIEIHSFLLFNSYFLYCFFVRLSKHFGIRRRRQLLYFLSPDLLSME